MAELNVCQKSRKIWQEIWKLGYAEPVEPAFYNSASGQDENKDCVDIAVFPDKLHSREMTIIFCVSQDTFTFGTPSLLALGL